MNVYYVDTYMTSLYSSSVNIVQHTYTQLKSILSIFFEYTSRANNLFAIGIEKLGLTLLSQLKNGYVYLSIYLFHQKTMGVVVVTMNAHFP